MLVNGNLFCIAIQGTYAGPGSKNAEKIAFLTERINVLLKEGKLNKKNSLSNAQSFNSNIKYSDSKFYSGGSRVWGRCRESSRLEEVDYYLGTF